MSDLHGLSAPPIDGGDRIHVDDASHVKVFGRAETIIQAGAGREGDDLGWGTGCYPPGGDGGMGILALSHSVVAYSGVFPEGGPGEAMANRPAGTALR